MDFITHAQIKLKLEKHIAISANKYSSFLKNWSWFVKKQFISNNFNLIIKADDPTTFGPMLPFPVLKEK